MDRELLTSIDGFLWLAREEAFGILIAALLVGIAVASSLRMYFAMRVAKLETHRAIRAISDLDSPQQFTEHFGDFDERLRGERRFGATWTEFSKTLIPPLDHIDSPDFRVYRATKRPSDYFDSQHVLRDVRPFGLESENLIGLGLIFTFLGLIAALIHAGLYLGGEGTEGVIKDLLSTAGAKFFASLGGVCGALIQTLAKVSCSDSAERELEKFISRLESLLPFANLEKIAAEQYAHAVRQTARLEEMGAEITLAIGSRIENALTSMPDLMRSAVSDAMAPTNDRLEKLSDGIASTSTDAMGKLVEQFTEQLTGAGEQTMNQVVGQLESLSGTLHQTVAQLSSSNAEIRTTMTSLLEVMKSSGSQFDDSIKGSADAAAKQMAEVSESVASALNQLISKLDEQHQETSRALSGLVTTFSQAGEEAAGQMRESSKASSKAIAEAIQEALAGVLQKADTATTDIASRVAQGVDAAGREMSEQAKAVLEVTSGAITESMEKVTAALEAWRTATVGATTAMGQVRSALADHQSGLESINSRLVESGVAIGASTQTLREATGPLAATTGQLASTTEALRKVVSESMARLSEMGAVTNKSAAEISQAIQDMVIAWEKQSSQLEKTDQQIERAFLSVVKNLEESLGTLSRFTQSLNDSLGSSIRDLGTIAAELHDAVEELGPRT